MTGGRRLRHGLIQRLVERANVLPQLAHYQKTAVLQQYPHALRRIGKGVLLVGEIRIAAQELAEMDLIGEAIARFAPGKHRVRIAVDKSEVLLELSRAVPLSLHPLQRQRLDG